MTKCQWLEGEPKEQNFCGKETLSVGSSWCEEHGKRVFAQPKDSAMVKPLRPGSVRPSYQERRN